MRAFLLWVAAVAAVVVGAAASNASGAVAGLLTTATVVFAVVAGGSLTWVYFAAAEVVDLGPVTTAGHQSPEPSAWLQLLGLGPGKEIGNVIRADLGRFAAGQTGSDIARYLSVWAAAGRGRPWKRFCG